MRQEIGEISVGKIEIGGGLAEIWKFMGVEGPEIDGISCMR
jgi:hypothetical protein